MKTEGQYVWRTECAKADRENHRDRQAKFVAGHDKEFGLNPKSNGKPPLTNIKQKEVTHSDSSLRRSM